jgi:hypothetical protein
MKPVRVTPAVILGALVFLTGRPAGGQGPGYGPGFGPYRSPPVSPYLNLLRAGASPGINYYDLVRPQLAFSSAIQGLQQQVSLAQQTASQGLAASATPTTGHGVGFMTQSRYFFTLGRQNAGFNGQPAIVRPLLTPPSGTPVPAPAHR